MLVLGDIVGADYDQPALANQDTAAQARPPGLFGDNPST